MADLTTEWLGLALRSPFVVSASPLSRDPEAIAAAVEAGAGAVVMHSLFEEQLVNEQLGVHRFIDARVDADAEARSTLPDVFAVDGTPYLRELERLKARVNVPVVASLNGTTPGGWTDWAARLEGSGASAIELNLYEIPTSAEETGSAVEERQLAVVASVVRVVKVPVTVKLGPFYASVPAFVRRLAEVGARGVTVFNRFYQPDVALDTLDVDRHLVLSTPAELPLRLHALAVLSPLFTRERALLSLGCTGGVHGGLDAAKAILCGAHVVQLASALLKHGPYHLGTIAGELDAWLEERGYRSSSEARGILDLSSAPDPAAWERLNYVQMLDGWSGVS
jgi:dihydroorotate dehydrogenase (fumarate)